MPAIPLIPADVPPPPVPETGAVQRRTLVLGADARPLEYVQIETAHGGVEAVVEPLPSRLTSLQAALSVPGLKRLDLPKLQWDDPYGGFVQCWHYFSQVYARQKSEAFVWWHWDDAWQRYLMVVPARYWATAGSLRYPTSRLFCRKCCIAVLDGTHFCPHCGDGQDDLQPLRIRGTTHSHGSMPPFHSGTDHANELDVTGFHNTIGRIPDGALFVTSFVVAAGKARYATAWHQILNLRDEGYHARLARWLTAVVSGQPSDAGCDIKTVATGDTVASLLTTELGALFLNGRRDAAELRLEVRPPALSTADMQSYADYHESMAGVTTTTTQRSAVERRTADDYDYDYDDYAPRWRRQASRYRRETPDSARDPSRLENGELCLFEKASDGSLRRSPYPALLEEMLRSVPTAAALPFAFTCLSEWWNRLDDEQGSSEEHPSIIFEQELFAFTPGFVQAYTLPLPAPQRGKLKPRMIDGVAEFRKWFSPLVTAPTRSTQEIHAGYRWTLRKLFALLRRSGCFTSTLDEVLSTYEELLDSLFVDTSETDLETAFERYLRSDDPDDEAAISPHPSEPPLGAGL